MKRLTFLISCALLVFVASCSKEKFKNEQKTDSNGYKYETVTNDMYGTRIYTLSNGLKVFMSVNKDEPRVQTFIAVKAGSTYDPKETTGLAHYLEHMMFKGTSKFATTDWAKEEPLLNEISDLYEKHKVSQNPDEKKRIYAKIDSVSAIAAKYAIPNEYDKMISGLGAKGTNAYTTNERTVYINNIPSNEIEKWLTIETERFSKLVLRLFHTEIEAVYEEFNMSQDYDESKEWDAVSAGLFPNHPYGTQTTIGKPEHLKNPSMVNIHNYWNTYYVPNNMAMCLVGDFDMEKTIKMVDNTFGKLKSKDVPELKVAKADSLTKPVMKEVMGPKSESVMLGWRCGGINTEDRKYLTIIDKILYNGVAGLIDLDLVQKQQVLSAYTYADFLKDYSALYIYAAPRQGQKLEELKDLLLAEVNKIKKGEFDEWLIEAVANDKQLQNLRDNEGNQRSHWYVYTFTNGINWADELKFQDGLRTVTKKQIVDFANNMFKDNHVVVYKRQGKDTAAVKVDKPKITPVQLNRESKSEYFVNLEKMQGEKLQPVFLDFEKLIAKGELKKEVAFDCMKNTTNELFGLYYVLDMGSDNDVKLPLAIKYLPYLGTEKYSPSDLKKEFYKLGIDMQVFASDRRCYIYIRGLDRSFEKGIELFEHVLANAKPDKDAYDKFVDGIYKERSDIKTDKEQVFWEGIFSYAQYGKTSSKTNVMSNDELKNINPADLTKIVKELATYKHRVFYYGPRETDNVKAIVAKNHILPAEIKAIPEAKKFEPLADNESKVFFVDFDMVQANFIMTIKDQKYDASLVPVARLFNEYYGSGLSSIVFQEIRESKALAYSAFSSYSMAPKKDNFNFVYGYVATQADKLKLASEALGDIMTNMRKAEIQFKGSKDAVLKRIESERITKNSVYWTYLNNLDLGITYDIRKDIYEKIPAMTIDDMQKFFDQHIKGKKYNYGIIGSKKLVDQKVMQQLGKVEEVSLKDLFNY